MPVTVPVTVPIIVPVLIALTWQTFKVDSYNLYNCMIRTHPRIYSWLSRWLEHDLSPYWKCRIQVRHFEKSACSLRDLCFRLQISTLQLWFSHALSWCHWVTCVASSGWVDNHACTMRVAEHGSHFLYYNFFGPPIRHFVSTEYLLYSLIPWKTNIIARSHFVFCSVHTF